MTAVAGDVPHWPGRCAKRDRLHIGATQAIGAAGAVGTLTADDPGVTVAKNASAGTYDITFPKAQKARIFAELYSPAGTVKTHWWAAYDAAAGTAQLVIGNGGGTATNPASGDEIWLTFKLDMRAD
jgi:hypothetical protein